MATTVKEILTAAYSRSAKNRPGHIASESTELLQVVVRTLRRMFALSVRHNTTFYGERKTVAYSVDGWPRPAGVQSINRIERLSDSKQVSEVPYDDREAEKGIPSVYSYGQKFYPAGNANDPTNADSLVLFCSTRPAALTTLEDSTGTLDARWPEDFNEILINRVARYLALKEGSRGDEVAALDDEYKEWLADYVDYLQHETTTLVRRYGHGTEFNTRGAAGVPS